MLGGTRIGFHGDLGIFRKQRLQARDDPGEGIRREEAGGSTTEENRVDGSVRHLALLGIEIEEQCIHVSVFVRSRLSDGMRVEVAVRTFPDAPGDVDVECEPGHLAVRAALENDLFP